MIPNKKNTLQFKFIFFSRYQISIGKKSALQSVEFEFT